MSQQPSGLGSVDGGSAPGGATQPIVHMRQDSDSTMKALFDVLKKNDQSQGGHNTWGNRKLPPSFFKPPEPGSRGSHSREGSQDSAAGGFAVAPRQVSSLIPNHGRSRSSPATLPISIATPNPGPLHVQQKSVDLVDGVHRGESPHQGWDSKEGQRYILNQSWQQPLDHRKSNSNHSLNSGAGPQNATPTLSPSQSLQHSPAVSQNDLNPLPPGWEQGMTPQGEVYFINHIEKTTSWLDPRIPVHLQKPGPRLVANQPQGPVPQNALTQQAGLSTSQHSPSPAQQPTVQRRPLPNDKYIQVELQKLQREKERLQREQEEISQKEVMLRQLMNQQCIIVSGSPMSMVDTKPTATLNTMQAGVTTSSVDPFLGQASNPLESHARQNSADSGLGMGLAYSLPRTPEDFLSNVDEMDTQDGGHKLPKHHMISSDFNMNELQTSIGIDLPVLGDPTDSHTGMDSDDLVPSLQDEISPELLSEMNDMDVPKMDNLLYL